MTYFLDACQTFGLDYDQTIGLIQLFDIYGVTDGIQKDIRLEENECAGYTERFDFASRFEAIEWIAENCEQYFFRDNQEYQPKMDGKLERSNMLDTDYLINHRDQYMEIFKKMGFVDEKLPEENHYDIAMIYGALEGTVIERIEFVVDNIVNEGIEVERYIGLGASRKLWPFAEPIVEELLIERLAEKGITDVDVMEKFVEVFGKNPSRTAPDLNRKHQDLIKIFELEYGVAWPTESDMMEAVIRHNLVDVEILNAQSKEDGKRAETADNIDSLRLRYPIDDDFHIIAISNQPFLSYQQAVAERKLGLKVDIAGPAMDPDCLVSVLLDSVANVVHERYLAVMQGYY